MSPHAIIAPKAGGPEVFEYVSTELPVPGPGQLLVKVAAAGVNFIETYQRSGVYRVRYPFIPGSECSGTVEAVGAGVSGFAPGDRVATAEGSATYADYTAPRCGQGAAGCGRRLPRGSRRTAAAGNDRPLPDQLQLQRQARRHRADVRRGRRGGPAADPAAQASRRNRHHHHLDRGKGRAGAGRRGRPRPGLRRGSRPRS